MLIAAQWVVARRLGRLAWGVVCMAPAQAALFVLLHLLAQAALLLALVLPWKLIAHAVGVTLPSFRVALSPTITRPFFAVPRTSVARTA